MKVPLSSEWDEIVTAPESINQDLDTSGLIKQLQEQILLGKPESRQIMRVGRVVRLSDGVAFVDGLSDCLANELLIFPHQVVGMAMNLERQQIGVVLLGDYSCILEGDPVYRSGRLLQVPTGKALLGRVVDALGNPIDGKGALEVSEYRKIEEEAPDIISRQPVNQPLQTGILAIDSMIPIGRGQRELIIGDRQIGKTTLAIDAIINQRDQNMVCVYVAIGQKESTVRGVVQRLIDSDAMDYTIVVAANASDPTAMQYIAPYAGCAMAEYFMYRGQDVLIVYDDLSKQAVAYRELSLLLNRPPGREAYPGDVFYLHSRLLERSARLNDQLGGGSMTALPIIETQFGDVSAYIPTNVISITDGQIFLEAELFHAGQRPAVNAGISVSRVGGSAQIPAMKQVAGRMRIDLAQYRELQTFAQFGADLDEESVSKITQGDVLMALLQQAPGTPLAVEEQILLLHGGLNHFFDRIPKDQVKLFKQQLLNFFHGGIYSQCLKQLRESRKLLPEIGQTMENGMRTFVQTFLDSAQEKAEVKASRLNGSN